MLEQLLRLIFEKLNDSKSEYVVLRNYDALPYSVGNDLDILISPRDSSKIKFILLDIFKKQQFNVEIKPVQLNGIQISGAKTICDGNVVSLSIHLQYWVSCEISKLQQLIPGLSYKVFFDHITPIVWEKDGCKIFVPSNVDQFGLLLRQWVYKKKKEYEVRLSGLEGEQDVFEFLSANFLKVQKIQEILKNENTVRETLKQFAILRWGKTNLARNYGKAISCLFVQKGLNLAPVIYMTGPDGAGKTSASQILSQIFEEANIEYQHIYSMKRNIIRSIVFYIRRKWHGKKDPTDNKFSANPEERTFRFIMTEDIFDRDDASVSWRLRKMATLLISIFDVFVNSLAVLFLRLKGKLVVVETSPYDIFIKYHMPNFKIIETCFAPLIPKPSLGLILTAEPQKIYASVVS